MNRMFRVVARSLAVLVTFVFPIQAADLLSAFPENTTFVISSTDVERLQSLDEHAVTKVLTTPELRKAFAPGLKRWEDGLAAMEKHWKDESGLSVKELRELFDGGAAFGFAFNMNALASTLTARVEKRDPDKSPVTEDSMQGMIMAHFAGDEATAEKVMNGFLRGTEGSSKDKKDDKGEEKLVFPDDYTSDVHEERGVKLHVWSPKKTSKGSASAWALVDKVLILTNGEKTLKACVERLQQGGSSFAESPAVKDLLARMKTNDLFGIAHVQPFMQVIETLAIKTFSEKSKSGPPGMPDPAKIFGWLGLTKFEIGYMAFDFKGEAMNVDLGVAFKEKPGVLKLIATSGPGTMPDFLPVDATSGGFGTMSLDRMMGTIEEFLADVMPPVNAMVSVKLDEIRRQSGADIKKDLLGNLGPDYWTVTGLPAEGLGAKLKKKDEDELVAAEDVEAQVVGFRMKDRKTFELALSSILNWALPGQALFEKSDYQGFAVQQFKGTPVPVGYVITDDWFMIFVGPRVVLDKVLSRLRKGGGGEHLFNQPHVASAMKALPEGGDGTSYADLGVMLGALAEVAKELPGGGEPNPFIDFDALPDDLKIPLTLTTRTYNEEGGLRLRIHIEEKNRP
jgi:hypothetical protein